jgi:hypothetical protein
LSTEDRELLAQIDADDSLYREVIATFQGRMRWMNILSSIVGFALFGVALVCGWAALGHHRDLDRTASISCSCARSATQSGISVSIPRLQAQMPWRLANSPAVPESTTHHDFADSRLSSLRAQTHTAIFV